jgi:hypothetical protein
MNKCVNGFDSVDDVLLRLESTINHCTSGGFEQRKCLFARVWWSLLKSPSVQFCADRTLWLVANHLMFKSDVEHSVVFEHLCRMTGDMLQSHLLNKYENEGRVWRSFRR